MTTMYVFVSVNSHILLHVFAYLHYWNCNCVILEKSLHHTSTFQFRRDVYNGTCTYRGEIHVILETLQFDSCSPSTSPRMAGCAGMTSYSASMASRYWAAPTRRLWTRSVRRWPWRLGRMPECNWWLQEEEVGAPKPVCSLVHRWELLEKSQRR